MSKKISQDIISFYSPYKNENYGGKSTLVAKQKFQVEENYQIINLIDKNSKETIVAARKKNQRNCSQNLIAIKKVTNVFEHKIFAKNTLRELKILRNMKHQNIANIQNIILPKSRQQFQSLYLVQDYEWSNLKNFILQNDSINEDFFKFLIYQLLKGLKYMHSAQIIHNDIKPKNLLLNWNLELKIFNFSQAKLLSKKINIDMNQQSNLWYKAPQILMQLGKKSCASDIWSVGCIFAEMILKKPIFQGYDKMSQLSLIFNLFDISQCQDFLQFSSLSRKQIQSLRKRKQKNLMEIFSQVSQEGFDLLKKLLCVDPEKRITAQQALRHPFLSDFHLQEDQPKCEDLNILQFQFEDFNLTTEQLKDLIYEQILLYNFKEFQQKYKSNLSNGKSTISHILNNSNKWRVDQRTDNDQ